MNQSLLLLALSAALGVTSAHAADTGAYAGGSIGQSSFSNFSASDLDAALADEGITSSSSTEDSDTGWKVFIGYQFLKYLAVEGAYTSFGKATANSLITSPVSGVADTEIEASSWSVSALGILPLGESFSLFGRVGANFWDADTSVTGSAGGIPVSDSVSTDGTDWVYGVGAVFNVSANLGIRGEWERYVLDDDVDLYSVGVSWKF
jgi:OOP family OmpA-OmpF porin